MAMGKKRHLRKAGVQEEDRPRFRRLLSPWFLLQPKSLSPQQKPTSAFTRLNPRGCLTPGISISLNKNRPNSGHSQKIRPTFSSKLAMGTDILKNWPLCDCSFKVSHHMTSNIDSLWKWLRFSYTLSSCDVRFPPKYCLRLVMYLPGGVKVREVWRSRQRWRDKMTNGSRLSLNIPRDVP